MAAMTSAPTCLVDRLAAWPSSPASTRPVRSWIGHPQLGSFGTAGEAAVAARSDRVVLAALVSRRDEEPSTLAALSVVAAHLGPVVGRWARGGVPAEVLEDMDAGLVLEALSVLDDRPGLGPERVAGLAWQRVSGRRRTERSRAARQVALTERHAPPLVPGAGRLCLTGSTASVALAALSGWGPAEAAARFATTPAAWRARTARARRAVRAELGWD